MGALIDSHIEVIPGSIDLILLMYHFVIFNIVYAVYERCERCMSDVSGVCVSGMSDVRVLQLHIKKSTL